MRRCNYNLHGAELGPVMMDTERDLNITAGGISPLAAYASTDQVWSLVTLQARGSRYSHLAYVTRHTAGVWVQIKNNKVHLHRDHVPLLVRHGVLGVGVLAHHAVQAAVGHLGVAGAREVHGEHLQQGNRSHFLLISTSSWCTASVWNT